MQLAVLREMIIVICEGEHAGCVVHLLLVCDANGPLATVREAALYTLPTLGRTVSRMWPWHCAHIKDGSRHAWEVGPR